MAKDFQAFEKEEKVRMEQGGTASASQAKGLQASTEVLVAESPAAAYQMAVAQDQEVQLLGAAQMVNEMMLESRAAKNDD